MPAAAPTATANVGETSNRYDRQRRDAYAEEDRREDRAAAEAGDEAHRR